MYSKISKGFLVLLSCLAAFITNAQHQENAAPSIHLTYYFPQNDAVLKMQKVKIVASAHTSFFEVNQFKNGYTGLQQTPDEKYAVPNVFISSLWDYDTEKGIHANLEYKAPTTIYSRLGGEGTASVWNKTSTKPYVRIIV